MYNIFDKRSKKPIYFTDPGTDAGAVVEILDYITVDDLKDHIEFIPPNPIAIQLDLMNSCLQQMKSMSLITNFTNNSKLVPKEKIYENTKIIYDYITLTQQAIIFGYTALETFTNLSIPDSYKYEKTNHKGILEIYDKKSIERHICLKEKISEILVHIYKTKSIKKQKFWNDFIEFEKYRHEIIHQKSIDHSEFYRKYF